MAQDSVPVVLTVRASPPATATGSNPAARPGRHTRRTAGGTAEIEKH
jgi:hypothetical protein